MPRTYKTGPARSRRRPDPAQFPRVQNGLWPLLVANDGSTTLSLIANISLVSPADRSFATVGYFSITGRPSKAFVIDSAGNKVTGASLTDNGDGTFNIQVLGPFPTGSTDLIIPGDDNSIRGQAGEWMGATLFRTTLT